MQVLFYLFAAYFFLLPVLFFQGFSSSYDFPKLLFTEFSALLILPISLVYLRRKLENPILKINIVNFLLLLLAINITASTILSKNPVVALLGFYPSSNNSLLFILAAFVLMQICCLFLGRTDDFKKIGPYIAGGLLLSCFYGIYMYINVLNKNNLPEIRINSTESNSIVFGANMMAGLYLSLAFARLYRGLARSCMLYGSFFFLIGIIMSLSRGVWISAVLGFLIPFLTLHRPFQIITVNNRRTKIIFFLILAISLFVFGMPIINRFKPLTDFTSSTTSHYIRLLEIKDALKLVKEKSSPFGIGSAHLPFYYAAVRSASHNQTQEWKLYPSQIRNNYLDITVTFGYSALTIFLLLLFFIFYNTRKNLLNHKTSVENYSFNFLIFSGWVSLLIYGLFYFYNVSSWIYFGFFSAVLISRSGFQGVARIKLPKFLLTVLLLISIGIGIFGMRFIWRTISADFIFTRSLVIYNQLSYLKAYPEEGEANILFTTYQFDPEDQKILLKALKQFQFALSEAPYHNSLYQRQYAHTLALLGRMQNNPTDKWRYYNQAYDVIGQETKENPNDYLNFELKSSIGFRMALDNVERDKFLEQAIQDEQKAILLDLTSPIKYDNLGLIYREAGKLTESKQAFEQATKLKPDFLASYIHLGEIVTQLGDKNKALQLYKQALSISPNNELVIQKINILEK